MSNFFNVRARQQAAATAAASSSKSTTKGKDDRTQPWVEK